MWSFFHQPGKRIFLLTLNSTNDKSNESKFLVEFIFIENAFVACCFLKVCDWACYFPKKKLHNKLFYFDCSDELWLQSEKTRKYPGAFCQRSLQKWLILEISSYYHISAIDAFFAKVDAQGKIVSKKAP